MYEMYLTKGRISSQLLFMFNATCYACSILADIIRDLLDLSTTASQKWPQQWKTILIQPEYHPQ